MSFKKLLDQKGMEQKDLSEIAKVRETTISEMARNINKMFPRHVLEKIADALDIKNMNDLISFVKE
ncbi:helix-turn-helix domain-containing protein [Paenibacillus arenosi]|uniref:Helix-turn-helix transcriptional regulator n=1 Tax=Paenibacillus arenosi TaxID=2774142 RepID=A0ABR9B3T1_9BACL|nr:helix-turn-helix transcriptional regulator [Paenibacillus arenosi]MBD8501024.1 helix-turn-helix transcriptional regulator [Paenibacillus arenosi]